MRDCCGQAVVEAALIIPMLLILLMGIILMGYWLNAKQIVTAAAREGARTAANTGDFKLMCNAVASSMQILDTKNYQVNVREITVPLKEGPRTDPLPAKGKSFHVIVEYKLRLGFTFFQKEYEDDPLNAGKPYPFTQVVGQAATRMERDPVDAKTTCK